MAVSTTNAYSGPYTANGVTTIFPFTFTAPTPDEVTVVLVDEDGVETTVPTSSYSVTLGATSGGSVTFSTAPDDADVVIYLSPDFTQDIQFEDGSAWLAAPVNEQADRSAARDQYLKARIEKLVPHGLLQGSAVAGKFMAWDAVGNPIASTGTGADAGLRTDLADSYQGAALVKWLRNSTGSVGRSIHDLLNERSLRVTDFGADPTGTSDSLAAIVLARTAAIASGKEMVFPQGTYLLSATLELGYARLHVRGEGRVVLQADFDGGNVVSFDAGAGFVYAHSYRNFIIRGNGSANQVAFYKRNMVHGFIEDVKVRNVTKYGFHITGDVFSTYERLVLDRQNEGGGDVWPTHGVYLDAAENGPTTACVFRDCIIEEGSDFGLYLAEADACRFVFGGAEGLAGWGVYVSGTSHRNQFEQFYCEQNALGDFDVAGDGNLFLNCEAYDPAQTTTQFNISGDMNSVINCGVVVSGTKYTTVNIVSGAVDTVIRDCDLYKLTDAGTGTVAENYSDAFNNKTRAMTRISGASLINAADDTAAATAGVPVGYIYRNGNSVQMRVS